MDPNKQDACMWVGFSNLGLRPAAGCCKDGCKPWVLQNPQNHTFVSRSCF
jgi:hypothetical protein